MTFETDTNGAFEREMELPSSVYYDKALSNWIGQMVGNILGLSTEGQFIEALNPEYVTYYTRVPEGAFTDDDTSMEWVFLHMLEEHGLNITYYQVREEWMEHINRAIWVANARARELMDEGYLPPETGSKERNENWGAIECELFGVIHPSMGCKAYEMAKWFAKVTNDDYAVELVTFYAVMFSYAFLESDAPGIVKMPLTRVPTSSLTYQVISDVMRWHRESPDWRVTRQGILEKYGGYGWVSSPLNLASVVMALLYGNGDFDLSIMIAVAAGWDNDCNVATTGGLLGTIVGENGINDRWKAPLMNTYRNTNRDNLPSETITNITSRTQAMAEKIIRAYGGTIVEEGAEKVYVIKTDMPWIKEASNHFSADNLARRRSSAPICHNRYYDTSALEKLTFLNDEVVWSNKPHLLESEPANEEVWWGYTFGDTLNFNQVVFYQRGVSGMATTWKTLAVQYRDKIGRWRDVMGLKVSISSVTISEGVQTSYIRILLSFKTANGTGVRVIGQTQGSGGGASISEVEVFFGGVEEDGPPSAPGELRVSLTANQSVLLEWKDSSDKEYGFVVKRRKFGEARYIDIANLGTNINRYVDVGTQPNAIYYYVVVAVNSFGSSSASNETSIYTPITLSAVGYILYLLLAIGVIVFTALLKVGKVRFKIVQGETQSATGSAGGAQ